MSSVQSSDSEVTLFDEADDSGSETEFEADDDNGSVYSSDYIPEIEDDNGSENSTDDIDEVESSVGSEFDESGSTVMLLSSNDLESGSETDIEDVTQSVNVNRQESVLENVTLNPGDYFVVRTNPRAGHGNASRTDEGSQSQTRDGSSSSRTNQSATHFSVNEGAGPSGIQTNETAEIAEGANGSVVSNQSQLQYSNANQAREPTGQSQTQHPNTGASIIQSNLRVTLPTASRSVDQSRSSQDLTRQSESRPASSTRQQTDHETANENTAQQAEEEAMDAEVLTIEEPSRNDSLGDFQMPKPATKSKESNQDDNCSSDDDAETCIICYEPWTNSGLHRLSSLRCGHLFGQSCIEKWLKGQGGKCPQCNAKAKKTDIRVIYAKALRTVDTTDRDRALKELEKEKELRRKMELEAAQMNLKYQMAMEEVNRMKTQLRVQQQRARTQASFSSSQPSTSTGIGTHNKECSKATSKGHYVLDKSIMVSQNGGCRVISFDGANYSLIMSMPSPNQLFPGYGVKKISAMDLRSTQYVPVHTKMIRDVSFNGRHDGLMLSASIDKTVKITSLTSNTVVQTYNTEVPAWCCTWNQEDVNYIYAGLQNGTIRIYDTRQTSTEVEKLNKDGSRCPIVSLNYVPAAPGTSFWSSGLLSGTLEGTTFWEKMAAAEYRPQKQLDGNCTCLNFDLSTRHCLASFRPNKSHPATRHMMCELKSTRAGGDSEANQHALVTCNTVQTMYGGTTMKLLTKSALFAGPAGGGQMLVAAGDEASCSAIVWDANTGNRAQKLAVNATVLDVSPFSFNRNHYLACLTEKQVKLYRWQGHM